MNPKISQLITTLQTFQARYGDLEVEAMYDGEAWPIDHDIIAGMVLEPGDDQPALSPEDAVDIELIDDPDDFKPTVAYIML